VYDTTPYISGVGADPPPIYAGSRGYVSIYGLNFGSTGYVQVCTNATGSCAVAAGFSNSVTYWPACQINPCQINILLTTPSYSAGGTYYLQVVVSADDSGAAFLASSQEPSGNASNESPFAVAAPTAQITMGAQVVSGNAANSPAIVSVGQQIQLTGSVVGLGGLTVASQQWMIGGTTVKSYLQTLTYTNGNISQGSSTGLSTPLGQSDLSQPSITFYWIDGDDCTNMVNYTVTYTATLSDQSTVSAPAAGFRPVRPCAVTAPAQALTFNGVTAAAPAITFSPTYLGGPSMCFGTPGVNGAPDVNGITFNTSPITTTLGGSFAWLQLVNRVNTSTFADGSTQTLNSNGFVLDNGKSANGQPQYASSGGFLYLFDPGQKGTLPSPVDLPAVGLSGTNLSSVATNQQFQMFLMYQPSGANSIWVTLQQVNWNWAATIAFANGAWGMPTGTSFSANPTGVRSASLPQWPTPPATAAAGAITFQQ
jgi:hypothetical protein